ncbi:MAG: hypothetical protein IKQ00_13050 [Butyrivibrio sp.]|nr:hypothetical protein [Butyrivibrio sp.]MBR4640065.1 hypothetical protein [Butyrivibrio sp.]
MKIIVTVEGSRGKNAKDESFLDKLFGGLKKNKKNSKDSKDRRDTKKRRVTGDRKDS